MMRTLFIHLMGSLLSIFMKSCAKFDGAEKYNILGVRVMCRLGAHDFVKEALELIKEYDESVLKSLSETIRMVIFVGDDKKGSFTSDTIPAKRIALIGKNDQSHVSTPLHLAGWLLYYHELFRGVKSIGIVRWYREGRVEGVAQGKKLRKSFIAGIPPHPQNAANGSRETGVRSAH